MAKEAILLWDHDGPAAIDGGNNQSNGKGSARWVEALGENHN